MVMSSFPSCDLNHSDHTPSAPSIPPQVTLSRLPDSHFHPSHLLSDLANLLSAPVHSPRPLALALSYFASLSILPLPREELQPPLDTSPPKSFLTTVALSFVSPIAYLHGPASSSSSPALWSLLFSFTMLPRTKKQSARVTSPSQKLLYIPGRAGPRTYPSPKSWSTMRIVRACANKRTSRNWSY